MITATQHLHSQITLTSALGKPSLFSPVRPLENLRILIVETDRKLALLIKNILFGLGCQSIAIEQDGAHVLGLLEEKAIDLVITESDLKTLGGLELAAQIRRSAAAGQRNLPIIMMSWHNERRHVEAARDSGIDEYVLKPFAARSLLERIYQLIEKPRPFIISRNYIGPDRRRQPQNDNTPQGKRADGTPFVARQAPRLVSKQALYEQAVSDTPCLIPPDFALRNKIGFTVIDDTHMSVPVMVAPREGIAMLRHEVQELKDAYAMLEKNPQAPEPFLDALRRSAWALVKHGRALGYERMAQVAVLLQDYCRHYASPPDRQHMRVIYTYIDALSTLATHDIRGGGGAIGEALYSNLCDLMQYYGRRRCES